ncbi:hypothetical protein DFQ28_004176 [Apophysomyces sp. BC1034]|nr:hypothetical protein DFQ30_006003 [Apophysomyces sp. BC1015]KAG0177595.1 hypothetical protein DFQ29_004647 [Apophysomyces sp. BC1021]KAG0188898.1 hypothetical protein DFQ28_004176 [Apophysomyces sp. BC1034]
MSTATFSKNLFSVLGDDDEVRPQPVAPVKEVKKDEQPKAQKTDKRNGAPRGAQRTRGQRREGRPQRGRQFDRHSGTGLDDSEKKVKQAWGHAETAEAEAAKDTLAPSDPAAADQEAAVAAEPEEVVKTLDEYLAEKANKALNVVLPEARKANEGSDDAKWKDTVAFVKTEEPEYLAPKENKASKKSEKTRKEKVVLEIEQRFQEKPRGGFRGGERRGTERRGRGNGRRGGRQSNGPAVNLQDAAAFPSLSA